MPRFKVGGKKTGLLGQAQGQSLQNRPLGTWISAVSAILPQPLDYESREQYELRVSVQNEAPLQAAAPRARRGQTRVSVWVQDINEAPVFPENPLRTGIAEGAPPGTSVATFSARDPDTQQLQRIRWGALRCWGSGRGFSGSIPVEGTSGF